MEIYELLRSSDAITYSTVAHFRFLLLAVLYLNAGSVSDERTFTHDTDHGRLEMSTCTRRRILDDVDETRAGQ